MTTLAVLHAMAYRYVIELKRYPFNTIVGIVSFYIMFLLVFLGYRSAGGDRPRFGEHADGIVIGFFLVGLLLFVFSDLARGVMEEARRGTLEQLAMSSAPFTTVLWGRALAGTGYRTVMALVLLVMMMLTTGRWLQVDVPALGVILLLTVAGVQGVAFAVAGLALVFKQVEAALAILHLAIVALVVTPVAEIPGLKYLPVSYGVELTGRVLRNGAGLGDLGLGPLSFLALNSLVYVSVGMGVFYWSERLARQRGLLAHY